MSADTFDLAAHLAGIPRPPLTDKGFPAHAEVGPILAAKIARLLAALVALGDEDRETGVVYAVPLNGGLIALYAEEQESDTDPAAGLIGWLSQIDGPCWSFAGYVRPEPPADDTRSTAQQRTVAEDA